MAESWKAFIDAHRAALEGLLGEGFEAKSSGGWYVARGDGRSIRFAKETRDEPTAASVEASLKQVNFDLGDDWALVVDEDADVPSGTNAVYVND